MAAGCSGCAEAYGRTYDSCNVWYAQIQLANLHV
jgi:hypothetical protein